MPTITLSKKALLAHIKSKGDEWLKERIAFLGTDLESIEDDTITVEIFPNRPDLLSQQGFARALGTFTGQAHPKEYTVLKGGGTVTIDKAVNTIRPFTACAVVKGLHMTAELIKDIIQAQEKLHVTYGRNRRRCAIGVYPLEHITLPITYTAKKPNDIVFRPLESDTVMTGKQILTEHPTGKEYAHLLEEVDYYSVFIDAKGEVLSMPPIINSHTTGRITTSTKDVFIECSGFSYEVVHGALAMMVTMLADMGGEIHQMKLHYPDKTRFSPDLTPQEMLFEKSYIEKYTGYRFTDQEIVNYLARMGIGCEKRRSLCALIPAYRTDIIHPIDLVEDIAIAYGMDKFESLIPRVATIAEEDPLQRYLTHVRNALIGHGLIEVKNYNITSKLGLDEEAIRVASSASQEFDTLRNNLVLSLLHTLRNNKSYPYPQHLFEIGDVFFKDKEEETGVGERVHLALMLAGEDAGYTQARQILDSLFAALDVQATIKAGTDKRFIEGRTAQILIGTKSIGFIGEINPALLELFGIEVPLAAFEIDVEALHTAMSPKGD